MKRLIIVTHRRLDDDRSGSKTYLRRMIALAEEAGFSVTIMCLPRTTFSSRPWAEISNEFSDHATISWPGTLRISGKYVTLAPSVWARFSWRLAQEVLCRLKLGPKRWRTPWSNLAAIPARHELQQMAKHLIRSAPDVVMVEYSSLGPLLQMIPEAMGKALLVHDSFAAREALFSSRGEPSDYPNPPSFKEEAARLAGANVIFHASVNELETFKTLDQTPRHIWFRPTAPVHRDKLKARETAELVYIGANQQGSRDAITHFLKDIWPLVIKDAPTTKLNIVGPVGHAIADHLMTETVRVLGRVDDLTDFAGPDMIGLLPTRLMSGISIKVGEYLGMGVPIVAYPAGIDGYGSALDGIVQTADTTDAFAQTIAWLLEGGAHRRSVSEAGFIAAETVLQNPDVVTALKALVTQ